MAHPAIFQLRRPEIAAAEAVMGHKPPFKLTRCPHPDRLAQSTRDRLDRFHIIAKTGAGLLSPVMRFGEAFRHSYRC